MKFSPINIFSIGWSIFWRTSLLGFLLGWFPIFGIIWALNSLGWATRKVLLNENPSLFNLENISLGCSVGWRAFVPIFGLLLGLLLGFYGWVGYWSARGYKVVIPNPYVFILIGSGLFSILQIFLTG